MNYPELHPSFMQAPGSTYEGSDAIGIWTPFDSETLYEEQQNLHLQPPFKRSRHSEDIQTDSVQCTPANCRMPVIPPVNKGISNIFFKTRVCAKFKQGLCRNGESCNFAHGPEDLRQPPPNWEELVGGGREKERPVENWNDDQRIIHRMKLCKKFYNGEECPYGGKCNFLHEGPTRPRDDSVKNRENAAISIGLSGPSMSYGSGSNQPEGNRPLNYGPVPDAFRTGTKPVYWKTKLCTKWETSGQCQFGENCHFAHGQSELQAVIGMRPEVEVTVTGSIARNDSFSITRTHHPLRTNDAPPGNTTPALTLSEEAQEKKCLFKFKGLRKINRIYGDWLDDVPLLAHNLPSQVES